MHVSMRMYVSACQANAFVKARMFLIGAFPDQPFHEPFPYGSKASYFKDFEPKDHITWGFGPFEP